MNYDPQKNHRRSILFPGYDYSQCGVYFITICTRSGDQILAKPKKSDVRVGLVAIRDLESPFRLKIKLVHRFELTTIGEIVDYNWRKLPERFDVFVGRMRDHAESLSWHPGHQRM